MKLSIRSKLFLGICIPTALIYLAMMAVEYKIRKAEAISSMQNYLKELTESEAAEIEVKLSSIAQLCRTSAEIISHYHPDNTGENIELLRKTIASNDDIFGMAFAYEPSAIIKDKKFFCPYFCRNGTGGGLQFIDSSLDDYNYFSESWYTIAKENGKAVWTEPYYDYALGKILMCTYSVPIFIDGKFSGVSAADLSLAKLSGEVDEMRDAGGYCVIVSRTGRIISHPNKSYIMNETVYSLADKYKNYEFKEVAKKMTAGESGIFRHRDFLTGEPKWVVFSPIRSSGWSFAAFIYEDKIMEPIYSHIKRSICYLLIGLGSIAIIIFYISSKITRPIGMLAEAVEELGKGNLGVKVSGLKNTDEIGVLAREFNKMTAALKDNIDSRIREESARKTVEAELNVAREIQLSLLPRKFPPFPERKEFDLHAVNLPAKFMAGDFFDFFMKDDDTLVFTIADVSGKGVPAAMFMAVTRTMLRNITIAVREPAAVVKTVSDLLSEDNDKLMFVTIFYAHYNIRTGGLKYVNAGHNPPYLIRKDGKMEELEPTGPLAAVFPEANYEERNVLMQPDDTLVCFTDGVTEAYAGNGELFGEDRFIKLLSGIYSEDVTKIDSRISDEILKYSAGDLKDDVTLLVLRKK